MTSKAAKTDAIHQAELRRLIMCADRSRLSISAFILLATHVPYAALVGGFSLAGLAIRVLLLVMHRFLLIHLVPAVPLTTNLSLSAYVLAYTLRVVGSSVIFSVLSIVASLEAHGQLLSCSVNLPGELNSHPTEQASCPSALSAISALWATVIGLVAAVQYARTPSLRQLRWPLLQQDMYMRLRPHLRPTMLHSIYYSIGAAFVFLLIKWSNRAMVVGTGAYILRFVCGSCDDAVWSQGGGVRDGMWLLFRAIGFLCSLQLTLQGLTIAYTQPLSFQRSRHGAEEALLQVICTSLPALEKPRH